MNKTPLLKNAARGGVSSMVVLGDTACNARRVICVREFFGVPVMLGIMTDNLLADFQTVMHHFNLSADERIYCWKAIRRNKKRAAAIYRAIANSL